MISVVKADLNINFSLALWKSAWTFCSLSNGGLIMDIDLQSTVRKPSSTDLYCYSRISCERLRTVACRTERLRWSLFLLLAPSYEARRTFIAPLTGRFHPATLYK